MQNNRGLLRDIKNTAVDADVVNPEEHSENISELVQDNVVMTSTESAGDEPVTLTDTEFKAFSARIARLQGHGRIPNTSKRKNWMRNKPCPCGSCKKYKKCCWNRIPVATNVK